VGGWGGGGAPPPPPIVAPPPPPPPPRRRHLDSHLSLRNLRIFSTSPSVGVGPSEGLYRAIQIALPRLLPPASTFLISSTLQGGVKDAVG
jgi:hypothetical protein